MSEQDPNAHDPIDDAYVRAETSLEDDAARAARRARVLAAVQGVAADTPPPRHRPRIPGAWLAAASVAGLSALLAVQLYRPAPGPTTAPAAAPAAPYTPGPTPPASAPAVQAPRSFVSAAPRSAPPGDQAPAIESAPAPPAAPAPVFLAVPAPAPPPPPPPPPPQPAPTPAVPFAADVEASSASPLAARRAEVAAPAVSARTTDLGAALRDAAGRGLAGEVERLLARGAPVDGTDADGETALMKSVRGDRPATATILRRHGASLDARNHAGRSARDLAIDAGDPALDAALGLDR